MAVRNVAAIILAGGQGERLSVLSAQRAKPAVPFAGKYRIIDFTLSNCVNSGIYRVAVLTQYRPHSLNDHIGIGRPWDLDRMRGGVRMLQPYLGRKGSDWYRGTADAVYQNMPAISDWRSETLLILSGDHVYKMDYNTMLAFHEERKADVTVAVMQVPMEEAHRFGTLAAAPDGRVFGFDEKPAQPKSNLISMGIYVFNRDILVRRLEDDARLVGSKRDFGRDIVPRMVEMDRVYAYPFLGYWRDVGTIQSYWESNMGLLNEPPDFDLYDTDWVIHTRSEERPPARVTDRGRMMCSLISHGSIINGAVEHSVLSPGVFVAEGAIVRDSILFPDCIVGPGSIVDRAILDKNVVVGADVHLGEGDDARPNRTQPRNVSSGISVAGKGARIPSGLSIGRNCLIAADVIERDFHRFLSSNGHVATQLASGETVDVAARPDTGR
ncbi:MAG: glucose-1-phosphate adenylyltransferase [Chloroflexota bacterium]|nr:glucose-1-phosphate adenylyltransferase [Chloroflexota bacterium]